MRIFEEAKIGSIILKNRIIRSAAFEGMSPNHEVSDALLDYHQQVAKGGVGMTTVAYASVAKNGLAFPHQLWIREEITGGLKKLADTVHAENTAISIQIGHTGNMSKRSVSGVRTMAPSARFNLYGPTWPKQMDKNDIQETIAAFAKSVTILKNSGFDAVEIHAGHGYLISQFLSPYTNHREDEYGGTFNNRARFLKEVLLAVREAAGKEMAVIVKMNINDGFKEGITSADAIQTAQLIEQCGADAILLSGGFVSKTPMYVMRGGVEPRIMANYVHNPVVKMMIRYFGKQLMPSYPFKEGYFLDDGLPILKQVKIPVIAVGGLNSGQTIEKALTEGYSFVAIARALIEDPAFVEKLQQEPQHQSACNQCNYCVARIYTNTMACYKREQHISNDIRKWLPA